MLGIINTPHILAATQPTLTFEELLYLVRETDMQITDSRAM